MYKERFENPLDQTPLGSLLRGSLLLELFVLRPAHAGACGKCPQRREHVDAMRTINSMMTLAIAEMTRKNFPTVFVVGSLFLDPPWEDGDVLLS